MSDCWPLTVIPLREAQYRSAQAEASAERSGATARPSSVGARIRTVDQDFMVFDQLIHLVEGTDAKCSRMTRLAPRPSFFSMQSTIWGMLLQDQLDVGGNSRWWNSAPDPVAAWPP